MAKVEGEMFIFLPGFDQLNGGVCHLEIFRNYQRIALQFYNCINIFMGSILSFTDIKIREV